MSHKGKKSSNSANSSTTTDDVSGSSGIVSHVMTTPTKDSVVKSSHTAVSKISAPSSIAKMLKMSTATLAQSPVYVIKFLIVINFILNYVLFVCY
jgi:ABC-type bacteriocin/lantibiotic exporter with double-glycine peptidase domain